MSTILSKRDTSIQKNIRVVEDIEDMRTFLRCLYSVKLHLPKNELKYISISMREATDQFKTLWKRLSGSDTIDRFNSTYNLPEWRCRVGQNNTSIKCLSDTSQVYNMFSLVRNEGDYELVISSVSCKDIYFDKIVNTLEQISGVEEVEAFYTGDAVFKIDFNRL